MAKIFMWLCIFGCIAAFGLLAVGVAGWGTAQAMREADPATAMQRAEEARHQAEINRVKEAQARNMASATADVVAVVKLPFALTLSALCILAALGVWGYMQLKALHVRQFIEVAGIPVSRPLAYQGATLPMAADRVHLLGLADVEHAKRAGLFPAPVAGSKATNVYKEGNQAARVDAPALPATETPPALAAPVAVPSLAETLRLAAPGQVVIGYKADGSPVLADLDGIGATLIVGERGTGKTTGMAMLAAQLAARLQARLWIIDRHGRLPQSLTTRLAAFRPALAYDPAVELRQIETVLDMWEAEIEDRLAGRGGSPWALLIDEANSFSAAAATRPIAQRIGALSARVANEGRKLQMGVVAGAQIANTRSLAGSFPYTVSTFVAYLVNPVTIYPYLPADYANMAQGLERGQAVALHLGGVDVVRVPRAEPDDIQAAARYLPARAIGGGASDSAAWDAPAPHAPVAPPPAQAEPFAGLTGEHARLLTLALADFDGSFPVGRVFEAVRPDISKDRVGAIAADLERMGMLTAPGENTRGGQVARRVTDAGRAFVDGLSAHRPVGPSAEGEDSHV